MVQSSQANFTHQLQNLMQRVGISSFKTLARLSRVSERQLIRLRRGEVEQMRVDVLLKLSQVLQVTLTDLVTTFSEVNLLETTTAPPQDLLQEIADLKQEYQRLQMQLAQQRQALEQEFQQSSLQVLESLITFLPTIAHQVQGNPNLPAATVLRILQSPIAQLLQQWGIEAIAPVGAELPYDPQLHQIIQGTAQPGDIVKIRYTGYRQGDKLLYRAKVSPSS